MVFSVVPPIHWVTTDQLLEDCCRAWGSAKQPLAIDTEFMRVNTFYPLPGLIQVFDGKEVYLIDPLEVTDYSPLGHILSDVTIEKIFHSFAEDLEVLYNLTQVKPSNIFDTQLAAAFCGLGLTTGYQSLVGTLLGVDLDKGQTRSNWLQRPLTDEQVYYAAQDVQGLIVLRDKLSAQLEQTNMKSWFSNECQIRSQETLEQVPEQEYYRSVKLAWQLKPRELAVLRELTAWRERKARTENKPRNTFLNDAQLIQLSRRKPKHEAGMAKIPGIKPSEVRKWGSEWLQAIQQGMSLTPEEQPLPLPKPLNPHAGQWLKLLRDKAQVMATEIGIPVDLLARKKQLEALLRSGYPDGPYDTTGCLVGWRSEVIGEPVTALLDQLRRVMPPPRSVQKRRVSSKKRSK